MKTIRIFSVAVCMLGISGLAVAQTKTETFKVSGNCGMCKTKIEKAAKEAGAKDASWNVDTKELTVTYKSSSTNTAKIQQKIADVGYDNVGFKTTTAAYDKLHGCCKYDRGSATAKTANAPKKATMVRTAAKKPMARWIAARMANAPKKDTMVRIAAKKMTRVIIN